ncbi:hypothetical protein AMATHDRAFT_148063 [Amanita thiersii Skay4041]|uniref:Uncharacterized protein n=1 Tax=Amanita thiersii Skay4041 TaxID=703135 RepID=A0A2A9NGP4_9AGAR|nr:hypothetical protein AMATHDRAFT_148063 [Amanita thiersii Skay4041]
MNGTAGSAQPLVLSSTAGPAVAAISSPGVGSTSSQPFLNDSVSLSPQSTTPAPTPSQEQPQQPRVEIPLLVQQPHVKEEGELLLDHVNGQIELLEHTPDALVPSNDSVAQTGDDSQDWIPESGEELKRVKVYELIGSRWVDQGTAFCFGQISEDTNEALLVARAERTYDDIILSTAIRADDVYQRQQDTLIVWTELDGVDYALSFQDPEGCAEVWNFIREVQRHMNSGDNQANITSSPVMGSDPSSITTASIIRAGQLPQPQLGIIPEIERAIKALARTQPIKERICEYIMQEEYIKGLIDVMNTAEDLESIENLHALCSLMQTILMLNDLGLYEHILDDDIFFGVVGMLEYDPEFPNHKANYREFLHNTSQFHQPIPIRDPQIQRKIHHTYRLQFLKDVVLARVLDDSTFNVLSSCIIYNQIDIISHVQQDPNFLRDIVKLFVDEEMLSAPREAGVRKMGQQLQNPNISQPPINGATNGRPPSMPAPGKRTALFAFAPPDDLSEEEISLRREVILLVQQLCVMGKNVQLPARMALFRSLVDRGVLFAVQWALGLPEAEEINRPMISAAGEILSALLDHDLNGVRGHVIKQLVVIDRERDAKKKGADKAETLLEMVSRIMAQSRELGVQCQVGDALKTWMEIPTTDSPSAPSEANVTKPLPRKDDIHVERYMDYFYKHCIHILFKPFHNLSEWRIHNEPILMLTREQTNRFVYLCDLLYNFLMQHGFRSHYYTMSTGLMSRLATLFKAKDKHLRHASFRIFRLLLKQNHTTTFKHMIKLDVFQPILDLTLQESRRDNLLSCSCQEFFEHMRRENQKELINFVMTKHEPLIRQLAQTSLSGERFELLIRRYEMNNAPPPVEEPKLEKYPRPWPSAARLPDQEEESYFNGDDDDDDELLLPSISLQQRQSQRNATFVSNALKRKRRTTMGVAVATKGYRPPLRTPTLPSLVDYGEDENEDEPSLGIDPSSSSIGHPQLSSRSQSPAPTLPISTSPSDGSPSSSKLMHGQVHSPTPSPSPPPPLRRPTSEDEEDDNLLEALARTRSRPQTPGPGMMASVMGPMRSSEKRRRGTGDDDDDDELLERLSKSSKKLGVGMQKESSPGQQQQQGRPAGSPLRDSSPTGTTSTAAITTTQPQQEAMAVSPTTMTISASPVAGVKPGAGRGKGTPTDEPLKQRFKLKLGASSLSAVTLSSSSLLPSSTTSSTTTSSSPSAPPTPSETGVKDGDTG